jgi:glycosyltransferase involved in cell wall biosynthesis
MIETSVIICTHDPRDDFLSRVLNALRSQTLPTTKWELLLVDNASKGALERKWNISWHPHGRHLQEDKLGLLWARQRAIRQSRGNTLVFVDDDNVLHQEYLERAIHLGETWSILGAWGAGAIKPEFEVEPAKHLLELTPYLALRNVPVPRWTNVLPCIDATPWGAGLCVRRHVAESYCEMATDGRIPITGRRGTVLLSGDDVEVSFVACNLGMGVATFPELQLTHLIPKERISERYLLRIREGTETSNILLAYKWLGIMPRSPLSMRSVLALAKNLATTRGVHRRLHVAGWRAALNARKIIGATLAKQQIR